MFESLLWFILWVVVAAIFLWAVVAIIKRASDDRVPDFLYMAAWVIFALVVIFIAVTRFVPAFAQDAVVVAVPPDPSPWNAFLAAIMPSLVALAMAAISAAGVLIGRYANKVGGPRAEQATNATYQVIINQAAGWILARYGTGATLSPAGQQVKAAIEYIRQSYPKVDGIEPHEGRLADDIIAAFGQIAGGAKNK